ncbi:MAG: hypothetical protein WDO69_11495 [Pseudomonadota bacterium]
MSHAPLISSKPRSLRKVSLLLPLCALSALSCGNLDSFQSKPGEAYCGTIGLPDFQDGFVEEGSPSTLELALVLDIGKLTSLPGRLSSKDPEGICGTPDVPQVLFSNAPMRAIPELQHDVLSALTFGEGHDHDFFAWVDSTCQGTMVAVVSLMKNNYVELRLFKPAPFPGPNATAAERPGFALFHLDPKPLYVSEKEGGCGFPAPP